MPTSPAVYNPITTSFGRIRIAFRRFSNSHQVEQSNGGLLRADVGIGPYDYGSQNSICILISIAKNWGITA